MAERNKEDFLNRVLTSPAGKAFTETLFGTPESVQGVRRAGRTPLEAGSRIDVARNFPQERERLFPQTRKGSELSELDRQAFMEAAAEELGVLAPIATPLAVGALVAGELPKLGSGKASELVGKIPGFGSGGLGFGNVEGITSAPSLANVGAGLQGFLRGAFVPRFQEGGRVAPERQFVVPSEILSQRAREQEALQRFMAARRRTAGDTGGSVLEALGAVLTGNPAGVSSLGPQSELTAQLAGARALDPVANIAELGARRAGAGESGVAAAAMLGGLLTPDPGDLGRAGARGLREALETSLVDTQQRQVLEDILRRGGEPFQAAVARREAPELFKMTEEDIERALDNILGPDPTTPASSPRVPPRAQSQVEATERGLAEAEQAGKSPRTREAEELGFVTEETRTGPERLATFETDQTQSLDEVKEKFANFKPKKVGKYSIMTTPEGLVVIEGPDQQRLIGEFNANRMTLDVKTIVGNARELRTAFNEVGKAVKLPTTSGTGFLTDEGRFAAASALEQGNLAPLEMDFTVTPEIEGLQRRARAGGRDASEALQMLENMLGVQRARTLVATGTADQGFIPRIELDPEQLILARQAQTGDKDALGELVIQLEEQGMNPREARNFVLGVSEPTGLGGLDTASDVGREKLIDTLFSRLFGEE